MSSSTTHDHASATPLFVTTFKMKIRMITKRDAFDGRNGLVLTGVLTGVGTIACLLGLTLVIIYIRKRYKKRRKSKHGNGPSSNSFSKIKERISSDVGHHNQNHPSHLGKSHFSHSPPIGNASAPSTQPSLHITDQRSTSYFIQQAIPPTPPFQNVLPHDNRLHHETTSQAHQPTTRFQPYSSSIPISTIASPRRKISQPQSNTPSQSQTIGLAITTEEAVLPSSNFTNGRPSSYLPVPRGLTPLSMNFVYRNHGGSSSPSASFSQGYGFGYGFTGGGSIGGSTRPGFAAMPSSELMHEIQENAHDYDDDHNEGNATERKGGDEQYGHAISPFQNEVYAQEIPSPQRHANVNVTTQRRPLKPIQLWEQQQHQQQQQTARSAGSPSSLNLNFSYPSIAKRPNEASSTTRSHAYSRSTPLHTTNHTKADSSATATSGIASVHHHLRNRSNGTVMTYASSNYTSLSNATVKVQPVTFDDSPRSSSSANRALLDQQQQQQRSWSARPGTEQEQQFAVRRDMQGGSRTDNAVTASNLARITDGSSHVEGYDLGEASSSISRGYQFPTVSSSNVAIQSPRDREDNAKMEEIFQNVKRQGRRASGKLPDMLFSRTASVECGKQSSPSSPDSSSSMTTSSAGGNVGEAYHAEEDVADMDDESVLDPMDDVARRGDQLLYADIRLSTTSSIFGPDLPDATLMDDELKRAGLGEMMPSASSLMTSTSSTSTNASYYGMAV